MAKTEKEYEKYLNELYSDLYSDHESAIEQFAYITNPSRGEYITEEELLRDYFPDRLGTLLKQYDSIAFNVGYSEWKGEYAKGGFIHTAQSFFNKKVTINDIFSF